MVDHDWIKPVIVDHDGIKLVMGVKGGVLGEESAIRMDFRAFLQAHPIVYLIYLISPPLWPPGIRKAAIWYQGHVSKEVSRVYFLRNINILSVFLRPEGIQDISMIILRNE